jgi:hypothetical protein
VLKYKVTGQAECDACHADSEVFYESNAAAIRREVIGQGWATLRGRW